MAGPLNSDNKTRTVTCVKSRVTQTKAYSPAFEITGMSIIYIVKVLEWEEIHVTILIIVMQTVAISQENNFYISLILPHVDLYIKKKSMLNEIW